ncbi:hypothetical protein V8F20_007192 [Naviculisporaceae sp. PSN 640]
MKVVCKELMVVAGAAKREEAATVEACLLGDGGAGVEREMGNSMGITRGEARWMGRQGEDGEGVTNGACRGSSRLRRAAKSSSSSGSLTPFTGPQRRPPQSSMTARACKPSGYRQGGRGKNMKEVGRLPTSSGWSCSCRISVAGQSFAAFLVIAVSRVTMKVKKWRISRVWERFVCVHEPAYKAQKSGRLGRDREEREYFDWKGGEEEGLGISHDWDCSRKSLGGKVLSLQLAPRLIEKAEEEDLLGRDCSSRVGCENNQIRTGTAAAADDQGTSSIVGRPDGASKVPPELPLAYRGKEFDEKKH